MAHSTSGAPARDDARGGGRKLATDPALPDDDTDFLFVAHPGEAIDAAYVISRAIQLVWKRPAQVIGVAAASILLSWALLFGLITLGILQNSLWDAAGIGEVMHPLGVIVLLVIGWAGALLLQAPLVGSAIEIHLDERRGLFAELLSRGIARIPQLMVASAIVMVAVVVVVSAAIGLAAGVVAIAAQLPWGAVQVMVTVIGSLVIALYAMRAIAGFCLLVPVMLVERLEIGEAIGRSWTLGWRHGFAILSALILPAVLAQLVLFPTQFMPPWVGLSLGIVLGVSLALYQTAIAPVTYVAIREYVEGLHPGRVMEAPAGPASPRRPSARARAPRPSRPAKPTKAAGRTAGGKTKAGTGAKPGGKRSKAPSARSAEGRPKRARAAKSGRARK